VFCALVSGGLAVAGVVWGVVLLLALPRGLGSWLLGATWRPTYPLVVPQTLYTIGLGASLGALVGLHALAAARRSVRAMLIGAVLFVVFSLSGAFAAGAAGAVSGAAIAAWASALINWWEFRAGWRDHRSGAVRPPQQDH